LLIRASSSDLGGHAINAGRSIYSSNKTGDFPFLKKKDHDKGCVAYINHTIKQCPAVQGKAEKFK
jgi:hypothetical protein